MAAQFPWVPRLYYWVKTKYADFGGMNLSDEPVWMLGRCYHIREADDAQEAAAVANPRNMFAAGLNNLKIGLAGVTADLQGHGGSVPSPPQLEMARPEPAPEPEPSGPAVWFWLGETSDDIALSACAETWTRFSVDDTEKIERAYNLRQKTVDLADWYIHFANMEQQRIANKDIRMAVKRVVGEGSTAAGLDADMWASVGEPSMTLPSLLPGWGELLEHVASKIWFSYRSDFSLIGPPVMKTDAGWGCMLRTAQMILGQALVRLNLGRDWCLPTNRNKDVHATAEKMLAYRRILRCFGDKIDYPFSLHRMLQFGARVGKVVGEWYGPSTVAQVLQMLLNEHVLGDKEADPVVQGLRVWVSPDSTGSVYKDAVRALGQGDGAAWSHPVLLLLPLRLGLDRYINPVYLPAIQGMFRLSQTLGFIGGKPSASFYFIAEQESNVLYLDPHTVQPTIDVSEPGFCTESFHSRHVLSMKLSQIDPSLTLAFLVESEADLASLCERLPSVTGDAICNVLETEPSYDGLEERMLAAEDDDDLVLL